MRPKIIVRQCAWCLTVQGCVYVGELVTVPTKCEECDKNESCAIVDNVDLFNVSHGMCHACFVYYRGGNNQEVVMSLMVIMCRCGKVKKFGEWTEPTYVLKKEIGCGLYHINYQRCTKCDNVLRSDPLK